MRPSVDDSLKLARYGARRRSTSISPTRPHRPPEEHLQNKSTGRKLHAEHGVTYKPFARWLEHSFDLVLGVGLFVELALLFGNTAMRALTNSSLVWANEVAEYSLTGLAFIGGAIAYHRGAHLVVRFGIDMLRHLRAYAECARHYFVLAAAGMGVTYTMPMWNNSRNPLTSVLQLSKSWTLVPFSSAWHSRCCSR